MICVLATIETKTGSKNDLLAVFRGLVPQVRAEKGCIEYTPMIDTKTNMTTVRDNAVVVVEKWESLEALEAHLKTPHMAEFRKQTDPLRISLSLQILEPGV